MRIIYYYFPDCCHVTFPLQSEESKYFPHEFWARTHEIIWSTEFELNLWTPSPFSFAVLCSDLVRGITAAPNPLPLYYIWVSSFIITIKVVYARFSHKNQQQQQQNMRSAKWHLNFPLGPLLFISANGMDMPHVESYPFPYFLNGKTQSCHLACRTFCGS